MQWNRIKNEKKTMLMYTRQKRIIKKEKIDEEMCCWRHEKASRGKWILRSDVGFEFDEFLRNFVIRSLWQYPQNSPTGLIHLNSLAQWKPTCTRSTLEHRFSLEIYFYINYWCLAAIIYGFKKIILWSWP